eukprot:114237_1
MSTKASNAIRWNNIVQNKDFQTTQRKLAMIGITVNLHNASEMDSNPELRSLMTAIVPMHSTGIVQLLFTSDNFQRLYQDSIAQIKSWQRTHGYEHKKLFNTKAKTKARAKAKAAKKNGNTNNRTFQSCNKYVVRGREQRNNRVLEKRKEEREMNIMGLVKKAQDTIVFI